MDLQIHAKTFHQESLGMILIFYNTRENRWFSFFTLQERIAQKGVSLVSELEIPIHLHLIFFQEYESIIPTKRFQRMWSRFENHQTNVSKDISKLERL